jgi:hypothetical protein
MAYTPDLIDPREHDCPACCCAPCECCDSDDEPEDAEDREPDGADLLDYLADRAESGDYDREPAEVWT